jgi:hypothetical protein
VFWVNPYSQRNQRWRWLRPLEDTKAQETARWQALQREAAELGRECDELKREFAARRAARLREAEALRRECDLAWERFLQTFKRYAEQQKAGFNPNQPRVPAGSAEGGRWANGGGAPETPKRIRLAGEIPTNDPPEVPKDRPETSERRTAVVKDVARWLGRLGGPLAKIAGAAYWLYQYDAQITASLDPPKSLDELQRAVATPKAGYEIHHIVEQTPAEQDGYRRSLIDGPENLVRIPTLKHREITAWYQTKNEAFEMLSPREYLRGKPWEERTTVGLDALIKHGVLKP